MTLLELNGEQLRQKIEAELADNPALEQFDEHRCLTCGRAITSPGVCLYVIIFQSRITTNQ
jgi:DNA-directed RNA polymerase specialized sigma54-like protein